MEVIIGVLVTIAITVFFVFRDMKIQFNLAIKMLEVVSSLFISGELEESDYIARKTQIIEEFNWYQRHLYYKLKNSSKEVIK